MTDLKFTALLEDGPKPIRVPLERVCVLIGADDGTATVVVYEKDDPDLAVRPTRAIRTTVPWTKKDDLMRGVPQ